MPRVKRGVTARARHQKVFALAKGYRGRRKNVYRVAKQAVMKAGQYAYRDRRQRKRQFRQLWIVRINAGARENGLSYSKFMNGLNALLSKSTAKYWLIWLYSTKLHLHNWLKKLKLLWLLNSIRLFKKEAYASFFLF